MRMLVLSACLLTAGLAAGPAHGRTGRCFLQVEGRTYLNGRCEIAFVDRQGSFTIGAGTRRSPYFAYVVMNGDGTATGSWNEERGASHAHSSLGTLRREGACWRNDNARVCAYR